MDSTSTPTDWIALRLPTAAAQSVSLAEGKKHATPSHAHEQRVDALLRLDGTVADFRVVNLAVKLVLFGLMLSG